MVSITVALCASFLVVGASRAETLFQHDCRNYLLGEAHAPKDRLAYLCDRQGFSAKTCGAALATVPGHLTRRNIEPFCYMLESGPGSDKVIAKLKNRQGHRGESREVQLVNLDKAVESKKGQPDYLVASDDPPMFEEPPAPLAHPPPSPVDLTIAQPPDADGNAYNTPQWGVNGEQVAVSIPASSGAAPLESAPIPPPVDAPARAEAPRAEAAIEETAPAAVEAPRAEAATDETAATEETAPEDSAEAPADEAAPEDSAEAPAAEATPPGEEQAPAGSAEASADAEAEPEVAIEDDAEVPAEEGAASSQ